MNYTRAFGAAAIFYIMISVLAILLMEVANLGWNSGSFHLFLGILTIPTALLAAKWHFRKDSPPSTKKGLQLGAITVLVSFVADVVLRVPQEVTGSFTSYFSDWKLLASYAFVFLLMTYAGFEFDDIYTEKNK